jgi:acyl-[acyl-carrier-protein]-phospholipid O-acyltransferase/long-chain-fatty-acid--[acyl-carrier-protein] ligase
MNADIYKKRFLKPLLEALNCVPISPRTGKNDFESFNKAVSVQVNAGFLVAIFAEGTVSRTGQILEFKKGVEHLSKLINGPVVPIHFDNVSGTPFSYRAGRKHMLRFSFSTLRKKVRINVGSPIHGGVSAFALRQCIKELEVENFSQRLKDQPSISTRIGRVLSNEPVGFWKYEGKKHAYSNLPEQLSKLGVALGKSLDKETTVAVLLPKGPQSMLIYLWLLMNKKTIVPIDPNWTNEQRLFAINRSNAGLLITTKDINFSHWAPTENAVVFIDELETSMAQGIPVNVICKNFKVPFIFFVKRKPMCSA